MAEASTPANALATTRTGLGRFAPGISGNPNGRPAFPPELRGRLETSAPHAIDRLIGLLDSDDERIVALAADAILTRLYGRPAQNTETKTEVGSVQQAHLRALQDIMLRRQAGQEAVVIIDAPAVE